MSPEINPRPAPAQYPRLAAEAYVVGRYAPVFGRWLDAEWEAWAAGMPLLRRRSRRRFGASQVGAALRRLAVGRVVEGAVLVEVHRAIDCVRARARRVVRARGVALTGNGRRVYEGAQAGVDALTELTPSLLVPDATIHQWLALGSVVGECLRAAQSWAACGGPPTEEQEVNTALGRVRDAVGGVTPGWSSGPLSALAALAPTDPGGTPDALAGARRAHLLHLEVARLDRELRNEFRGMPAPQPVLVLDAQRLVFYGHERRLADLPHFVAGLLWVLAEHARRPVSRADLISLSGIKTDATRLQQPVSRLRALLRSILSQAGGAAAGSPQRVRELIRGLRSDAPYGLGPYQLDIDPSSVQIILPRPHWMPRV